jgi:hypothetical protein
VVISSKLPEGVGGESGSGAGKKAAPTEEELAAKAAARAAEIQHLTEVGGVCSSVRSFVVFAHTISGHRSMHTCV